MTRPISPIHAVRNCHDKEDEGEDKGDGSSGDVDDDSEDGGRDGGGRRRGGIQILKRAGTESVRGGLGRD